jgi:hypothetical protein
MLFSGQAMGPMTEASSGRRLFVAAHGDDFLHECGNGFHFAGAGGESQFLGPGREIEQATGIRTVMQAACDGGQALHFALGIGGFQGENSSIHLGEELVHLLDRRGAGRLGFGLSLIERSGGADGNWGDHVTIDGSAIADIGAEGDVIFRSVRIASGQGMRLFVDFQQTVGEIVADENEGSLAGRVFVDKARPSDGAFGAEQCANDEGDIAQRGRGGDILYGYEFGDLGEETAGEEGRPDVLSDEIRFGVSGDPEGFGVAMENDAICADVQDQQGQVLVEADKKGEFRRRGRKRVRSTAIQRILLGSRHAFSSPMLV